MKITKYTELLILSLLFSSAVFGQHLSIHETQNGALIMEIDSSLMGRDILMTSQIDRGAGIIGRAIPGRGIIRMVNRGSEEIVFEQRIYSERCSDQHTTYSTFQQSNYPINERIAGKIEKAVSGGSYRWDITDLIYKKRHFSEHGFNQLKYQSTQKPIIDSIYYKENSLIITFTAYYLKVREEFVNTANLTGTIPIRFSCAFTVLSENRMKPLTQSVDLAYYRTIAYTDFGISTHGTVPQWIVERWDPLRLPKIEIEYHCPALYVEAITEEIEYYNEALKQTGCPTKFVIRRLEKDEQSASNRFLITYDYGSNNISSYHVTDSLNGEILYGRLNIGDGAFRHALNENIWLTGMFEDSVVSNPYCRKYAKQVIRKQLREELSVLYGKNKEYKEVLDIKDFFGFAYGNSRITNSLGINTTKTLQKSKYFLDGLLHVMDKLNEEAENKNPNYDAKYLKSIVETGYDLYASGLDDLCRAIIWGENQSDCLQALYTYWVENLPPKYMIPSLVQTNLISVEKIQNKITAHVCRSFFTESVCSRLFAEEKGIEAFWDLVNLLFEDFNYKQVLSTSRMEINYQLMNSFLKLQIENQEKTTDFALRLALLKHELGNKMLNMAKKHKKPEMKCYYQMLAQLLTNKDVK